MSYSITDYWLEAFQIAWSDAGLPDLDTIATKQQQRSIAFGLESSAEHVGQAFYSPPPSDRIADITREHEAKSKRQEQEAAAREDWLNRALEDKRREVNRLQWRINDALEKGLNV